MDSWTDSCGHSSYTWMGNRPETRLTIPEQSYEQVRLSRVTLKTIVLYRLRSCIGRIKKCGKEFRVVEVLTGL